MVQFFLQLQYSIHVDTMLYEKNVKLYISEIQSINYWDFDSRIQFKENVEISQWNYQEHFGRHRLSWGYYL